MKNQKILLAILVIFAAGVAIGLAVSISKMDFFPAGPVQNSAEVKTKKKQDSRAPKEKIPPRGGSGICRDLCGNGRCEEVVCMGENCPCAETARNCPADCGKTPSHF